MNESFLYYLWENRLLTGVLTTSQGQPLEIINPGFRNMDSGPDYLEAKIKIGNQLWAGQVEIHVKTTDWNRHGHQHDKAYHNVVLHVVFEHDHPVNEIPVLTVKGHFDESLYLHFERMLKSQRWIACERQIGQIQSFTVNTWLERMAIERLEEKAKNVEKTLKANQFDWEDTLYRLLMRYFGMKVNNEPFETLATLLPLKTLLKHADNLNQVEAMLLGCAGFLEQEFEEEQPRLLKREYEVMRAKFGLMTMSVERWRFLRMRPVNFPTVRLAQMAQLVHQHCGLFSKIREADTMEQIRGLFNVVASSYWDTHYRFAGTPNNRFVETPYYDVSTKKPKHLGDGIANVLIINAVIPLLFCYGKFHKDERYCEKALWLLEKIPAEDNTIIRHFARCGIQAQNAMQTQALLHMYQYYCRRKRCLECRIGNVLLRSQSSSSNRKSSSTDFPNTCAIFKANTVEGT